MTAQYEGIVYDLDGTLVRLDVDWEAVTRDVAAVYADAGVSVDPSDLWAMMERAADHGLDAMVEETIERHERAGARRSERLPLADELAVVDVPVAVCSLNAEAACRLALDTHALDDHVETIVGRDTVSSCKPDPEPLLAALEAIGVDADAALFVGDSNRDEKAARRAGVDFQYVARRRP